jgi:hypothetical protein
MLLEGKGYGVRKQRMCCYIATAVIQCSLEYDPLNTTTQKGSTLLLKNETLQRAISNHRLKQAAERLNE